MTDNNTTYSRQFVSNYIQKLKNKLPHQSEVYKKMNKNDKDFLCREYNIHHLNDYCKNTKLDIDPIQQELLVDYIQANPELFNPDEFSIKNPHDLERAMSLFNKSEGEIFKYNREEIYGKLPDYINELEYIDGIKELSNEEHLDKANQFGELKEQLVKELDNLQEDFKKLREGEQTPNTEADLLMLKRKEESLLIRYDNANRQQTEHLLCANNLEDRIYADTSYKNAFKTQELYYKQTMKALHKEEDELSNDINRLEQKINRTNDEDYKKELQKSLEDKKSKLEELEIRNKKTHDIIESRYIKAKENFEIANEKYNKTPEGIIANNKQTAKECEAINKIISNGRKDLPLQLDRARTIESEQATLKKNILDAKNDEVKKYLTEKLDRLSNEKESLKRTIAFCVSPKDIKNMKNGSNFEKELVKDFTEAKSKNDLGKDIHSLNKKLTEAKDKYNSLPLKERKNAMREIKQLKKEQERLNYYNNLNKNPDELIKKNNNLIAKSNKVNENIKKKLLKEKQKEREVLNKKKPTKNELAYQQALKQYKSKNILSRTITYPFKANERRQLERLKRKATLDKINKKGLIGRALGKTAFYTKNFAKDGIIGVSKGIVKTPLIISRDLVNSTIRHPLHNAKVDMYNSLCAFKWQRRMVHKWTGGKRGGKYYRQLLNKNTWWNNV